ncbi:hypothetical protein [Vibrio cionasavignyae]|uniref:hypothetical protein n=1 Tax=Vibrio cionasavignyae TaxID=2910252 RepID=UPI003D144415
MSVMLLVLSFFAVSNEANEAMSHQGALNFSQTPISFTTNSHKLETATQSHCCASFCLLKVPCGQSVTFLNQHRVTRALMPKDEAEKAIARIQTLFRPPIA